MPQVDIVSDAFESSPGALEKTAKSILAQSFADWQWTVAAQLGMPPSLPSDGRIRVVQSESRAAALNDALATSAPYVAVVEAGQTIGPTALERWLWFLAGAPEHNSVSAFGESSAEVGAWLSRRTAFERAGGFDAARPQRPPRIAVPPIRPPHGAFVVDSGDNPNAPLQESIPFSNRRETNSPRLLVIGTWMALGGADKVLLDVLDGLAQHGWEATVATTTPTEHTWQSAYAARTTDLFALEEFLHLADYPRFLVYLIESRQPDAVLIANSELGYRLTPYLRARCPKTPFVDLLHSETEDWNRGGYPRFSLDYAPFLDRTIVVSEHLRRWLTDRGRDPSNVEVSYANVDTSELSPDPARRMQTRRRFALPADAPVVLFAGRVSEDKQPHVIVDTLARLARRQAPFTAVVAGDGPDLRWLERAASRRGLNSRLRLTGGLGHKDVVALMQTADVFFLPSRTEGIALTIYEAMACGLAVVGADVGGQSELVTPETGILVPRSDADGEAEAYANAIEPLLRDPALRLALGKAARTRVVDEFDLHRTGPHVVGLLQRAIESHRDSPPASIPLPAVRAWATEVVELTRLARANDLLWRRSVGRIRTEHVSWRERLYLALRFAAAPIYRYGIRHGWRFLPRARRLVERLLVGTM
jgi:glycosyltransferase involved in cell wall biosynthesis